MFAGIPWERGDLACQTRDLAMSIGGRFGDGLLSLLVCVADFMGSAGVPNAAPCEMRVGNDLVRPPGTVARNINLVQAEGAVTAWGESKRLAVARSPVGVDA